MATQTNGHASQMTSETSVSSGSAGDHLARIHEALELVHSPYSSNESRKQASIFLEELKTNEEAPYHGFKLAADKSQQPVVRHYALSLIEHAIKHKWVDYSEAQAIALREWVLQLSQAISQDDPLYLRNKSAQLWVEIAKRSWGGEWMDMDELLVRLWDGPVVHKEFVLFVLETLSEEVFNGEDTTAALREGVLSKACVEIFTPATVLAETFPNRQLGTVYRCGEEGWLIRLGELLDKCVDSDVYNNEHYRSCAVKILAVFRSVMPWAVPQAISAAQCVQHMCKSLAVPSVPVQMVRMPKLQLNPKTTNQVVGICRSLACPLWPDAFLR
jgi:exportin-5